MDLEWVGPEHAEEISAVAYPLFFEVYPYESRDTLMDFLDRTQSPGSIRDQMSRGMRYAFIVHEGVRAEYVGFGMEGDTMNLSKLYVFKQFRGRGLGSMAMDYVESEAKAEGASRISLEVIARNSDAIALSRAGVTPRSAGLAYPTCAWTWRRGCDVLRPSPLLPLSKACT